MRCSKQIYDVVYFSCSCYNKVRLTLFKTIYKTLRKFKIIIKYTHIIDFLQVYTVHKIKCHRESNKITLKKLVVFKRTIPLICYTFYGFHVWIILFLYIFRVQVLQM